MKKFTLALAALAMTAMPLAAQTEGGQDPVEGETPELGTVLFHYYRDLGKNGDKLDPNQLPDLSNYRLKWAGNSYANMPITALIYLPEDVVEKYDGCKAVRFHAVSGSTMMGDQECLVNDCVLIFRSEMTGRSFYSQPIVFGSTPKVWNSFDITEPVEIHKGEPFYVGFTAMQLEDNACPYVYDGFKSEEQNGCSSWAELASGMGMYDFSNWNGNLMMALEIQGEGIQNNVTEITATTAMAYGMEGSLKLDGTFSKATVYDLGGKIIAHATQAGTLQLPAGLYLVRFDNTAATKVIVK